MVYAKIRGMILDGLLKLAKTTTKAIEIQAQVDDDYVDDGIPLLQMQGVRFKPPADAELVLVCINGDPARPVAIMAVHRNTCPTDELEDGEGGLYINKKWLAFVASDETVSLGAKSASDFAPCASKVDAEIQRIWDVLTGWTVAPNDGGAALQTLANGPTGAVAVESTASSKVKVEP